MQMKFHQQLLLSAIVLMIPLSSWSQNESNLHFITDPSLSPDGSKVVFTYENDLWQASTENGTAYRLTAMEGVESHPRFSPDGQWLAFSSTKNGNADVYVMPVEGGKVKQLTWHDAGDYVESWGWDSRVIYFTSERHNQFTSFRVKRTGGTPGRMFGNYFNTPHHLVEDPATGQYYFTESWESYRFPQRKRYKGAHNPNIKSYNPGDQTYKEHTSYKGKDFWPTIDQNGQLYFVSDEWNGEYNLYTLENGQKKRLTDFRLSIDRPQVSANGEKVVFCKGYQPHVYDVQSGTTKPLGVSLFMHDALTTSKDFQVNGKITDFDVSPDNKKMAFVSRGRLFVSDTEGQFIRELNTDQKERVLEVRWMKDSKNLLYTQTVRGWANLFTISAEGEDQPRQLTDEQHTHRLLEMNNDRTQAAYILGRSRLMLMDLEDFDTRELVEDDFWFRGSRPRFSPDDQYIVYTAYRNFEQDVFVYDLENEKSMNLTGSGVTERQPYWSPDGKYIYLASDRFQASFPRGTDNSKIYRVPLFKFKKAFKSEEYQKMFQSGPKDTLEPEIRFDPDRLTERWEPLKVKGGQQFNPHVYQEKDHTVVLFTSDHDGEDGLWKMEIRPFEKNKTEKLSGNGIDGLVKAKDDYYTLSSGNIHKINLKGNKTEKIETRFQFSKKLQDEFIQMFYENWAILQENFYDKDFHGLDWKKMREKYEAYLPHIQTRANLRTLFNDMLGELNSSHLGFYSSGEEEETYYSLTTAATGIVFDSDHPWQVDRIVAKSPLDNTEQSVRKGDELVAVNGKEVSQAGNRNEYFSFAEMPEEMSLSFSREGERFEVMVHPVSSGRLNDLLYDEWIHSKQEMVDEQTGKKVAYVYMKDMGTSSLEEFLIDMTTETVHRDALILDLRYNRGGNVHDNVLQFLSQRPYLQWKFRGSTMEPQPNFAPSGKPIVMLVNEHSLSDAEMTAAGFKELNLGTIIGTETYRWIIFTSGKRLVDGSYTRLPAWGCYTLEGEDLEMKGVAPDIYVNNTFKDRLMEKDPQLQKAIEVVLEKLEE
jgi:tricorn protease